ncbi:MAG: hypothetical protein Q8P27_02355, partial [Candidatus Peregrinibacteria bacterium]|nr:hypothetical protein [Candidatus Peregrinibacteria bacterium]
FAILDLAAQIGEERKREVLQEDLNFWLEDAIAGHPSAGVKGKRHTKVLSVEQTGVEPPVFTFKVVHGDFMHFSYERYLENSLRDKFGFAGTGVKMVFIKGKDPNRPRREQLKEDAKSKRSQRKKSASRSRSR